MKFSGQIEQMPCQARHDKRYGIEVNLINSRLELIKLELPDSQIECQNQVIAANNSI
jgi:hypothetical protein